MIETFIPYHHSYCWYPVRAITSHTVALNLEHFYHAFVRMSAWCKGNALPMANLHTVTSGEHMTLRQSEDTDSYTSLLNLKNLCIFTTPFMIDNGSFNADNL